MKISIKHNNTCAVIEPVDDVGVGSKVVLTKLLEACLLAGRVNVIICLRKATAINQEGIEFLHYANEHCRKSGGTLVLVEIPPALQKSFGEGKAQDILAAAITLPEAFEWLEVKAEHLVVGIPKPGEINEEKPIPAKPVIIEPPEPESWQAVQYQKPAFKFHTPGESRPVSASKSQLMRSLSANASSPHAAAAPEKAAAEKAAEDVKKSGSSSNIRMLKPNLTRAGNFVAAPKNMTDDDLSKLIQRHVPGRIAIIILEYMVAKNNPAYDAASVAQAVHSEEKIVHNLLRELESRSVLRSIGGGLYNYAPEPDLRDRLAELLRRWRRQQDHGRIVPMLLAMEK